ncbi:MAG TPA: glycosyltransferase family 39 protein, partial [Gaiellaceae bacterium]
MASPSEHARDARIAAATCVLAGLAALAVALPAVWWESLHVDEATTLEYASHRFTAIVEDTFVERGGGPLSFFVEKATLWFPGGIEGLRGPSVLFFLAALPFAWLVGRRLVGVAQACALVFLLALAPLAVPLVTFARPYTPLLLGTLLAAWLSLRAADDPSRGRWIAAGVVAGLLPYVHPIAPLYAVLAFATGPLASRLSLREAARRAVPGAVALVVVALPYAYALAVLRRRYHVGYGDSGLLGTTHGRSVPEEALRGLAPDGLAGALLLAALAVLGLVLLWRSRRGAAIALALWIVVPVAFFTLVPVGGTRFFDRYLLPMLPAYLLLVATGCFGARAVGRVRLAVGGAAILGLLAWQALDASQRLRDLHAEQLPELVSAIPDGRPVLFAAT